MRTAIYLRQSLDRDQIKLAVSRQREDLLALCERLGWGTPVEYCDNSVSATKGTRPAYNELCADIRNGNVARLAVWDLDRLHRKPSELERFMPLIDKHNVELANCGGDVNLSDPQGRLVARVKGATAAYEIEQMVMRKVRANRQRATEGKSWVSRRTFGYDGDDIVADEAHEIREACAALLDGTSLWAIAKDWNSRGITTVNGRAWTGGTVKQAITRPRNAGLQVYRGEIMEGVETAWDAIVSRDTWESVRAYLGNPDRHTGKKRARVHLLSGIAVCGLCQRKMGTTARKTKRGEKRIVYQCKNQGCMRVVRDKNKTEALVIDAVTTLLARPDASVIFARPTVDTKALSVQAEEYRVLITAAERDYDEGLIDGKRLKGRLEAIQPKLEAVEAQLLGANATRKLDGLLGQPEAKKRFLALDLDRQRAVINAVAVVTIKPASKPGGRFDPTEIDVQFGPQDE